MADFVPERAQATTRRHMMMQSPSQRREPRLTPARAALALMGLVTLMHLLVAGRFDLSVDEAHYALYGLRLDWSYFDHPPLVGWLQALILPFGRGELALRLWPILLNLASGALLWQLTRRLYPDHPWYAPAALLWMQSAVVVQLLGLALVPDVPLLTLSLAVVLVLLALGESPTPRRWLLLGLLLGLAGLAKYTAVLLLPGGLVYLLWQGQWRQLLTPWPWLAALLGLLVITPVLYWNATHAWASFAYQLGHGAPDVAWSWRRFATGQGMQLFGYAPLIYLVGWAALLGALRHSTGRAERLTLSMVLPILLMFGYGGGLDAGLPHWTLLAWVLLAPLGVAWLAARSRRLRRGLVALHLLWAGVLTLLLHLALWGVPIPFKPYQHPLGDLIGWREAAGHAVALRERLLPAGAGAIYVGNWALGSRIGWYAGEPVRVADTRFDQFDLWEGDAAPGGEGILLVPDYLMGRAAENGTARFAHCREVDSLSVTRQAETVHTFTYYHCRGDLGSGRDGH